MKQLAEHFAGAIDASEMLTHARAWSAINTGTANLDGLAQQAQVLAEAFASLPGEVVLREPAPVTVVPGYGWYPWVPFSFGLWWFDGPSYRRPPPSWRPPPGARPPPAPPAARPLPVPRTSQPVKPSR